MYTKFIFCAVSAIGIVLAANLSTFKESKYIGALFFGYALQKIWGDEKPTALLATYWIFI